MTSSLLHSVPPCLHGTAEGPAAGGAVTVVGSGLIRTPCTSRNAPDGDTDSAGVPDHRGRASPAPRPGPGAPAIVQAAAAGLRRAISFAHQHLLFHPFAAA